MVIKLKISGTFFEAEVEGETVADAWQQAAFWHSLPTVCPVDGSPTRFGYANRGGYDFYFLQSTGEIIYEYPFGLSTEGKGSLFPGQYNKEAKKTYRRWLYWDALANNGEGATVVVWENGKSTSAGLEGEQDEQKTMALRLLDDLGESLYREKWASVRSRNVERMSGGLTTEAADLSLGQINKLNDGLRSLEKSRKEKGGV